MSLALVFQNFNKQAKRIGTLEIDAVVEDTLSLSSETTDHPVERGSEITDHIIKRPKMLLVRGFIGGGTMGGSLLFGDRKQDAYESLLEIYDTSQPVDVVTGLDVYPNMVMVSTTLPRNAQNATILEFTAEFKQIRMVNSERVDLSETTQRSVKDLAASARNAGRQATKESSEQSGSVLFQLFN